MRAYGAASSSSQTPAVANSLNALEIPHEDECVTLGCIGNMLGLLAGRSNNEMLGFLLVVRPPEPKAAAPQEGYSPAGGPSILGCQIKIGLLV